MIPYIEEDFGSKVASILEEDAQEKRAMETAKRRNGAAPKRTTAKPALRIVSSNTVNKETE